MNILDVISEINKKFNENYSNAGFKNTKHATSFLLLKLVGIMLYIKETVSRREIYLVKVPHVIFGLW